MCMCVHRQNCIVLAAVQSPASPPRASLGRLEAVLLCFCKDSLRSPYQNIAVSTMGVLCFQKHSEDGGVLAQAAQGNWRWPNPGRVEEQAGWALSNITQWVASLLLGTSWSLRSLPTPTVLWRYKTQTHPWQKTQSIFSPVDNLTQLKNCAERLSLHRKIYSWGFLHQNKVLLFSHLLHGLHGLAFWGWVKSIFYSELATTAWWEPFNPFFKP